MRWVRVTAIFVLVALGGCAGQPRGLLAPVDTPVETQRVNMLTATTRAASEDPAILYTGDRGDSVSFSNIVVSIPPKRNVGSLEWPSLPRADPETEFVVASVTPLKLEQTRAWFKTAGGKSRRVFVFVHGFNTRFDRAVFRFAQLAHDADADAAPVLFSWPSRGRILDYKRDQDNASYSRTDLADLLQTAANSPDVREICILAHSMGSWVAVEAVKQLALKNGRVPRKITNLILASPDLDVGVFRRQVEDMGPGRLQITVFVSQRDRALQLSRFLTRGVTRLGGIDPTREEYLQQLKPGSGVTVLDLTALRSNDRINHDLYAQSPAVVRLIGDRLINGQVITDAESTGASSAVQTIGSAAGLVVSAPLLVIEATTSN